MAITRSFLAGRGRRSIAGVARAWTHSDQRALSEARGIGQYHHTRCGSRLRRRGRTLARHYAARQRSEQQRERKQRRDSEASEYAPGNRLGGRIIGMQRSPLASIQWCALGAHAIRPVTRVCQRGSPEAIGRSR